MKQTYRQYMFGECVIIDDKDFLQGIQGVVTARVGARNTYEVTVCYMDLMERTFNVHARHLRLLDPPRLKNLSNSEVK